MKIEKLPQDNCTLKLTVEVDDDHIQPALRAAARQIAQRYRIPGFRPGKAPYDVILRQFGEEALYEAAMDDLGQKIYAEVLEQEKIEAYGPGALDNIQLKPMVLTFTIPLRPEVELGDYRALRLPFTPPQVLEQSVTDALENMRQRKAVMQPVDRPAELSDVAVLEVKGFLNEGQNPSDFLLADENTSLLLQADTDWPMPGFAPHVVGLRAGDEKKFDLTFPEDYANESLRTQTAHFEVKVKEVKSRQLPEWTDELARELSEGRAESVDALRTSVRAELEHQAGHDVEHEYEHQVVDQLVAQASLKYPPQALEQEIDDLLQDLDRRLREQRLTLDDYLKIEAKTREALREEYRPRAEERLKRALVLSKVVDLEQIQINAADVDAHVDQMSAAFGENEKRIRQMLSTPQARTSISVDLLTDRAIKRLTALARGEDVPLPEMPADVPLSTPVPDVSPAEGEAPAA